MLTCFLLLVNTTVTAQMKRVVTDNMSSKARQNSNVSNIINSCTADTIILTTQAQINNFTTNYPACTNPKYLFVDGTGASPAITNLTGLSSITQIIKKLKISNTSITSLAALSNLHKLEIPCNWSIMRF